MTSPIKKTRGRPKGKLPKGTCSVCGRTQPIRADGGVFSHHIRGDLDPRRGYRPWHQCAGSHKPPATTV